MGKKRKKTAMMNVLSDLTEEIDSMQEINRHYEEKDGKSKKNSKVHVENYKC